MTESVLDFKADQVVLKDEVERLLKEFCVRYGAGVSIRVNVRCDSQGHVTMDMVSSVNV